MSLAGNLPKDLGLVDLSPTEMMFWLYCPISVPGTFERVIPHNLRQFEDIIMRVYWDDYERFYDSYAYITAKTLYVHGSYIGNRPGWHIDGYGTNDLNYIWYDRAPTAFLYTGFQYELSDDCDKSMEEMELIAATQDYPNNPWRYPQTYPDKHLLRLDNTVIHRSPIKFEPGLRTFVKVSISDTLYDLVGNSINHGLSLPKPEAVRRPERNHPASVQHA